MEGLAGSTKGEGVRKALFGDGMLPIKAKGASNHNSTAVQFGDPKVAFGNAKPQLHLIPPAGNEEQAKALALGAAKYGERNWMRGQVRMTVCLSALKRHVDRILDGEDIDPESGAHHLGHVMAGCSIMLDAQRHGMLIDDRVLPAKSVVS